MDHHRENAWLRHQQARWLRPDAYRWVRPDAARFLAPGGSVADAFPALSRKYNPNQPRVPEATGWYARSNPEYDGLSPREYLKSQPESVRRQVGIGALIRTGVLKP